MQKTGNWRVTGHCVVIDATSKKYGRVVLTCDWKVSRGELTLVAVSWRVYGNDRVALEEDFAKYSLIERTLQYRKVAKLMM